MSYDPKSRDVGYGCLICIVIILGVLFGAVFLVINPYIAYAIGLLCGVIILGLLVKDRQVEKVRQNTTNLVLPSRVAKHDIEPISIND